MRLSPLNVLPDAVTPAAQALNLPPVTVLPENTPDGDRMITAYSQLAMVEFVTFRFSSRPVSES